MSLFDKIALTVFMVLVCSWLFHFIADALRVARKRGWDAMDTMFAILTGTGWIMTVLCMIGVSAALWGVQ